ncbi:MAG: nucleoside hydrolase [Faecousia sp.]
MKQEAFRSLFPEPDFAEMTARLRRPTGKVDIILDTDTYNEIDDQFALSYLLRSEESVTVRAVTAAPFYRDPKTGISRSDSPADGMEKSYHEILKILRLAGREDLCSHVYRGSTRYLPDEVTPVESEAARKILALSADYSEAHPLYILAIGASTNVASALLMDPTLTKRCVVVWLAGHAHHWNDCSDFNVSQDISAARILFGCGVPLVQFPMFGVVSEFRFSKPELEYWFRGKSRLSDYLIDNTYAYCSQKYDYEGWSKPLWDLAAVCWVVHGDFLESACVPAPIPTRDFGYSFGMTRHPMQYVYCIHKDPLIADVAAKLSR